MTSGIKKTCALVLVFFVLSIPGKEREVYDIGDLRPKVEQGMQALYAYRLQEAEMLSSALVKAYPHQPAVRLLRANYYWNLLIGGFNTQTNREQVFRELKAAEEGLKTETRRRRSNEDLFADISIKMMKARIHGLQGSQFRAFSELNSAVNEVKHSFGREMAFPYFKLSTGLYLFYRSYARERYPFTAPYLMLLPSGNREKGIQMLEEGFISKDDYLSCESGYFLVKIMIEIKNYASAFDKANFLLDKYPNNLIFAYLALSMALKTGQHKLAQQIYRKVLLTSPTEAAYLTGQKEYFMIKMRELLENKPLRANEKSGK